MSLNCETTELTPLRRNSHSRRQQQSSPPQQNYQHIQYLNELHHGHQEATSASNQLQSTDFSGYMSINNNNHPVGSDSSHADISEPNSQQAFNPKSYTMGDTKRTIRRITIDGAILLCGESIRFSIFFFFSFFVWIFYHAPTMFYFCLLLFKNIECENE